GLETPEYSWVGLTARAVGTIVHAELRRLASQPELPQAGERQQRAGHYGAWLSELGVPAEAHAGAEALVVEALERTLADPRGRWLLSAQHPAAESEWRLTGTHEGRIVNVVFDRMLIDDQRQRWIIDYKTSRHEGGELAQFIEREAERYTPQLQRYAALAAALGNEVVRVALYFPLLGVFREVSP
ncbi:MAG: PD-(D/E)XK nuclease family protein, partial [Steroidobacteraceae bacterium]